MSDFLSPRPAYEDRSALLIFLGILELGLAVLFLLFVASMGFAGLVVSGAPGMNVRSLVGAGLIYLSFATFFGIMGVGTIRARRWARTLMLSVSWMWLAFGLFACGLMVFILPRILESLGGSETALEARGLVSGCMIGVMGLLYVVLPGLFVLAYRGANVKATFEARDPRVPWTDRVPLPVLALSVLTAMGALGMLLSTSYGALFLFGRVFTGAPAVLGAVVISGLLSLLTWATYQRRPAAWWGHLAFWTFGTLSSLPLLLGKADMRDLYGALGAATPEMERMGIYDLWKNPAMLVFSALAWAGWLGFLLWMRKYFRQEPPAATEVGAG